MLDYRSVVQYGDPWLAPRPPNETTPGSGFLSWNQVDKIFIPDFSLTHSAMKRAMK